MFQNLISVVHCCQNFSRADCDTDTVNSFIYQYQRSIFKPCSPSGQYLKTAADGGWVLGGVCPWLRLL